MGGLILGTETALCGFRVCLNLIAFITDDPTTIFRRFDLEQLMSVSEAARRLGGISKWTVHAWLSQGRLQRTKVGGRTMIRESELQRVIEDGAKSAAPRRQRK
jgi:excisionase family DNA binding protein